MKKYILISCFGLFACQQPTEQTQEATTMPDEKMATITADIALADGGLITMGGYKRDSLAQIYYQQIFELHGTTLEEYEKNLQAISANTPRLEAMIAQAKTMITSKMDNPPKEGDDKKK